MTNIHSFIPSFHWTDCVSNLFFYLLLLCPLLAVEWQQYFGDSIIISDVFQDSDNLVEFLISSRHLPPM